METRVASFNQLKHDYFPRLWGVTIFIRSVWLPSLPKNCLLLTVSILSNYLFWWNFQTYFYFEVFHRFCKKILHWRIFGRRDDWQVKWEKFVREWKQSWKDVCFRSKISFLSISLNSCTIISQVTIWNIFIFSIDVSWFIRLQFSRSGIGSQRTFCGGKACE